jgi:hypothetical protein
MASASLSGISMLNSYSKIRMGLVLARAITDLLNGHDHLYRVETVQSEVVGEVSVGSELYAELERIAMLRRPVSRTLDGS